MSHGKNQQRKGHLKHLEAKRERQRHAPAKQPALRPEMLIRDAPGWMQQEYLDRHTHLDNYNVIQAQNALHAYRAGYVRGLLGQVRDLLLRRMDQLNVAAFEADKASGKDVSVIIFNKPAEETEDWKDMKPLLQDGYTDLRGVVHPPVSEPFQVDDKPATAAEVKKMVAAATQAPVKVVCPLCNHPITFEDALHNCTVVTLNKQPVQVHKNCPGEK